MDIVIFSDVFTGHLFHDIEQYIVAFEKLATFGKDVNKIYLVNDSIPFEGSDQRSTNEEKLKRKWNNLLFKRLFHKENYEIINSSHFLERECDPSSTILIRRKDLDHKNINKGFAASILNFPTNLWYDRISETRSPSKFSLLYSVRYNCGRGLDARSEDLLQKIIKRYNGTMCDMANLTIEEQIEMFRNHNVVIGVHGNNLTGIMWMGRECHVMEILPVKYKADVYDYHCLSLCMKNFYTQIDCNANSLGGLFSLNEKSLCSIEYNLNLLKNLYS